MTSPKIRYNITFKQNAVDLIDEGYSAKMIAEAFGVHTSTMSQWCNKHRQIPYNDGGLKVCPRKLYYKSEIKEEEQSESYSRYPSFFVDSVLNEREVEIRRLSTETLLDEVSVPVRRMIKRSFSPHQKNEYIRAAESSYIARYHIARLVEDIRGAHRGSKVSHLDQLKTIVVELIEGLTSEALDVSNDADSRKGFAELLKEVGRLSCAALEGAQHASPDVFTEIARECRVWPTNVTSHDPGTKKIKQRFKTLGLGKGILDAAEHARPDYDNEITILVKSLFEYIQNFRQSRFTIFLGITETDWLTYELTNEVEVDFEEIFPFSRVMGNELLELPDFHEIEIVLKKKKKRKFVEDAERKKREAKTKLTQARSEVARLEKQGGEVRAEAETNEQEAKKSFNNCVNTYKILQDNYAELGILSDRDEADEKSVLRGLTKWRDACYKVLCHFTNNCPEEQPDIKAFYAAEGKKGTGKRKTVAVGAKLIESLRRDIRKRLITLATDSMVSFDPRG